MKAVSESDSAKGHAIYTPTMLKIYNVWVLDISNQWIWRCRKSIQLEQYNRLVSHNHLDIGVGTGYYLKNCRWPSTVQLSLMDLNPNCLETTKNKLVHYEPKTYLADIFQPQLALAQQFNSIAMNYLFHCLPGNMETKSLALANAVAMLAPGGVLFGATILADEHLHTRVSRKLCDFYNKKGIFSNRQDTQQALHQMLAQHLTDVNIKVVGCVALFSGKVLGLQASTNYLAESSL